MTWPAVSTTSSTLSSSPRRPAATTLAGSGSPHQQATSGSARIADRTGASRSSPGRSRTRLPVSSGCTRPSWLSGVLIVARSSRCGPPSPGSIQAAADILPQRAWPRSGWGTPQVRRYAWVSHYRGVLPVQDQEARDPGTHWVLHVDLDQFIAAVEVL